MIILWICEQNPSSLHHFSFLSCSSIEPDRLKLNLSRFSEFISCGRVFVLFCFVFLLFAKLNWPWQPHSFLADMLQHMQYTIDKCVYFLYCALLNHKQQDQQQSAATMPSKPAVTGKCQCFKTQLLSCRPLWSAFVLMYAAVHACARTRGDTCWEVSELVLCTPRGEGTFSKREHSTQAQPTLWCHFIRTLLEIKGRKKTNPLDHLSNSSSSCFSSRWTESGGCAPAHPFVCSWEKCYHPKLHGGFQKEEERKRLGSITDVAL